MSRRLEDESMFSYSSEHTLSACRVVSRQLKGACGVDYFKTVMLLSLNRNEGRFKLLESGRSLS